MEDQTADVLMFLKSKRPLACSWHRFWNISERASRCFGLWREWNDILFSWSRLSQVEMTFPCQNSELLLSHHPPLHLICYRHTLCVCVRLCACALTICHTCMMLSSDTEQMTHGSLGFQEKSEILAVCPPWMNWNEMKQKDLAQWSRFSLKNKTKPMFESKITVFPTQRLRHALPVWWYLTNRPTKSLLRQWPLPL